MQISINKEKLNDIENAFSRLKTSSSDISALRTISDSLKGLTGKNIQVKLVKPENDRQECTVMSVYPEESTLDKIINAIVTEQSDSVLVDIWNKNESWVIEVDERMLMDVVGLTPRELTSLLLHEVGHAIYSNSLPMRISRVIRFEFARTGIITKQVLKNNLFTKLLYFPLLNVCNLKVDKSNINEEIYADKYSVKSGYGKDLNTAIDKIVGFVGTADADKDTAELMGFSIDTISQLEKRQNVLVRRNMQQMLKSTPSIFAKSVLSKVSNIFNTNSSPNMTESFKDDFITNKLNKITNDFYVSEGLFNRPCRLKKIDPADIDYIGLEIGNIKSNDDKMMIVSYIYNKIETIEYYLTILESKSPKYIVPHSQESLIKMRDTLEKYKSEVINMKIPEIRYGINIQWPTGYEG